MVIYGNVTRDVKIIFFSKIDYHLLKINFFLIIDYHDAIMTHYKLCHEAWGGRSLTDRRTSSGGIQSPNGDGMV